MAILSKIVNVVNIDNVPGYIVCEYSATGIGADTTSTELIMLNLPARKRSQPKYRTIPNLSVDGVAYAIELNVFSISCSSRNFDVSILNKNDITLINTINEVARYTGINLSESDQDFSRFVIRNRDNSLTNAIYIYLNNHDTIPTGNIRIELAYLPIQDNQEFEGNKS